MGSIYYGIINADNVWYCKIERYVHICICITILVSKNLKEDFYYRIGHFRLRSVASIHSVVQLPVGGSCNCVSAEGLDLKNAIKSRVLHKLRRKFSQ